MKKPEFKLKKNKHKDAQDGKESSKGRRSRKERRAARAERAERRMLPSERKAARKARKDREAEQRAAAAAAAAKNAQPDDTFGLIGSEQDAFEVSVRNAEPIIRRLGEEKRLAYWTRDIQINVSSALMVFLMFCLFLTAGGSPTLIPFALPCIAVFLVLAVLEMLDRERIRMYVAIAMVAALIVTLVIFRKYIGGGWALLMNQLYDEGEIVQSYIYDRFHVGSTGQDHPYRSMHAALLWGSSLLGLVTGFPPVEMRRGVASSLSALAMLAFAYYGILPSWICIGVLAALLIFVLSKGSLMSTFTVLIATMLVFGAILLIDPGENYTISRADENFRDRFALSSSFLQREEEELDVESLEKEMQEQKEKEAQQNSEFMKNHRAVMTLIVVLLILAAIAAAVYMFMQRLRKRQAEHRKGIDSKDPREAIVAMFPYTVRWLQPAGIEVTKKPFISLLPMIRADVSEEYADRYMGMYDLWKEAAYSDHDMTEESRNEMNSFMQDTIDMVKDKSDLTTRFKNTLKYAL